MVGQRYGRSMGSGDTFISRRGGDVYIVFALFSAAYLIGVLMLPASEEQERRDALKRDPRLKALEAEYNVPPLR